MRTASVSLIDTWQVSILKTWYTSIWVLLIKTDLPSLIMIPKVGMEITAKEETVTDIRKNLYLVCQPNLFKAYRGKPQEQVWPIVQRFLELHDPVQFQLAPNSIELDFPSI